MYVKSLGRPFQVQFIGEIFIDESDSRALIQQGVRLDLDALTVRDDDWAHFQHHVASRVQVGSS